MTLNMKLLVLITVLAVFVHISFSSSIQQKPEKLDDEKKLNAEQEKESDEDHEEVEVEQQGLLSEGGEGLENEIYGDDAKIEKAYDDEDDKIEAEAKEGHEGEMNDELKVQQQESPAASVEDKELDGEDDGKMEKVYTDDDEKVEAEDNELAYANIVRNWPYGTYALPRTTRGCPPGWRTGWRYQDNEDNHNINSWTRGINYRMKVVINRNLKMYYCVKIYRGPGYSSWPRGTYCIAKRGLCPSGFRVGSVYWDDEDRSNRNRRYGYLPNGVYNRNTKIYFCCRRDGLYYRSIRLPTTRPFYLYRYGSRCQRVYGMNVRSDFIRTDDEDTSNRNRCTGAHPAGTCGRNIRINFCYYYRRYSIG